MDLGARPKSHTERLKTEFVAAKEANPSDPIFNRFQMEYEANIFAFVDECDRRIRAAHRRLEKTPEENAKTTNLVRLRLPIHVRCEGWLVFLRCGRSLKLNWLSKEEPRRSRLLVLCNLVLAQNCETHHFRRRTRKSWRIHARDGRHRGSEKRKGRKGGEVIVAPLCIPYLQTWQRELQQLTDTSGASGHQKLRVCDVCGAYLSVLDSDRRLADHFGGKVSLAPVHICQDLLIHAFSQMHLGYHELRNMLTKFKEEREKRKMAPPPAPAGVSGPSAPAPSRSSGVDRGGDYRASRDDYRERDRDRGYDRHSSRHEYVMFLLRYRPGGWHLFSTCSDRRRDRDRSRSPRPRKHWEYCI